MHVLLIESTKGGGEVDAGLLKGLVAGCIVGGRRGALSSGGSPSRERYLCRGVTSQECPLESGVDVVLLCGAG